MIVVFKKEDISELQSFPEVAGATVKEAFVDLVKPVEDPCQTVPVPQANLGSH